MVRTLDDVIKIYERGISEVEAYDAVEDALHYLKVLQKMQKAQPVTKGEWDELYNPPLTWDELRAMEGKPVWVEQCNGDTKGWLLILRTNY